MVWGLVVQGGENELFLSRMLVDVLRKPVSKSPTPMAALKLKPSQPPAQLHLDTEAVENKRNELQLLFFMTVFYETSHCATKHFFGAELVRPQLGVCDGLGKEDPGHRLERSLLARDSLLEAWIPKNTIRNEEFLWRMSCVVLKTSEEAKILGLSLQILHSSFSSTPDKTQLKLILDSFLLQGIWRPEIDDLQDLPLSVNLDSHLRLRGQPEPEPGDGGDERALREMGLEPLGWACPRSFVGQASLTHESRKPLF
ncbi:hypothetical protein FB45DRAFT_428659 [Roridomyces roridus]|uniref:Uncharacterized protein n=1 Tax=Roridomyces roridus TaxID=1738132 RepID=A0AAD7C629_9AGAR|nr:hypothetical protein FB45DRAFT_428659 [Roridomyces roridus]